MEVRAEHIPKDLRRSRLTPSLNRGLSSFLQSQYAQNDALSRKNTELWLTPDLLSRPDQVHVAPLCKHQNQRKSLAHANRPCYLKSHMKNYRPLQGDGSAKVVVSGESHSPFTTAPRCEPSPHNSRAPDELCTCSVRVLAGEFRPPARTKLFTRELWPCTDLVVLLPCPTLPLPIVNRNLSKKPVSSRKFTFQHSVQTPYSRASDGRFARPLNVDCHRIPAKKARNVAYCRITEKISETLFAQTSSIPHSGICALKLKKPVFAHIRRLRTGLSAPTNVECSVPSYSYSSNLSAQPEVNSPFPPNPKSSKKARKSAKVHVSTSLTFVADCTPLVRWSLVSSRVLFQQH
jgi:hypothetical protein